MDYTINFEVQDADVEAAEKDGVYFEFTKFIDENVE